MKKVLKIIVLILLVVSIILCGIGIYYKVFMKKISFYTEDKQLIETVYVKKGNKVELIEEPKIKNWEFIGWAIDGNKNNIFDKDKVVDDNYNLYASYIHYYEVSFSDIDGKELFDTQVIKEGESATKPEEPYKPANDFLGWTFNGNEFIFDNKIDQNTELVASWLTYEPYELGIFGLHCATTSKTSYGYSYNDIKKLTKGLEFVCYMGGEVKGSEHYMQSISYQFEYGKGFKLVKAADSAKVTNNLREITLKKPAAVYDEINYYFKVVDISDPNELYVKATDIKVQTNDGGHYSSPDLELLDLTKNE